MRKSKVTELIDVHALNDKLENYIDKSERELNKLKERLKILECPHSITEIISKWAGITYFVEVCKQCGKVVKELTDEEYHRTKYESLMKQAAVHKKFLTKTEKEEKDGKSN